VGTLQFGGQQWFFEGLNSYLTAKGTPDVDEFTKDIDFIVLSQGLDDHAHKPTLKALPRSIRVVASPSAAEIARSCGLQNVSILDHGDRVRVPVHLLSHV
jgi:L-ascorbate metabolism protein UlaG (beta-lactamase superfamily)